MDVTPQLLHDVEFREAKRGGYNTQDVDEFLERLAVGLERQDATLREARQRVEAAEGQVAEAERQAAEAMVRANEASDTDDTLKRTLVLAQRTADAAIKEADEQASRTLGAAQDQAARLLADAQEASARARAEAESEARRAQEEARVRVLAELRELEAARDQIHADVDVLERHLADQRDRVRVASRELQRLLDDPTALRESTAPSVSEVAVPAVAVPAIVVPEAAAPIVEVPVVEAPVVAVPEARLPDPEPEPELELDLTPGPEAVAPTSPPSAAYAEVDLDAPGHEPSTQPIDVLADRDPGDDAYLAELRKAMTDESPLGPREEGDVADLYDQETEPQRSRFGRRR